MLAKFYLLLTSAVNVPGVACYGAHDIGDSVLFCGHFTVRSNKQFFKNGFVDSGQSTRIGIAKSILRGERVFPVTQ